jgi:NADPH:quinone reductase-like Zn-dependent oxidoreductase
MLLAILPGEAAADISVLDYRRCDPLTSIPKGSVDFVLDTTSAAMQYLPLLTPKTGVVISIAISFSTAPSGKEAQASEALNRPDHPRLPFLAKWFFNVANGLSKLRAWRYGVHFDYMSLKQDREGLDSLRDYIEDGKLRPVVGKIINLRDFEQLKQACQQALSGKGGVGKTVIEIISQEQGGIIESSSTLHRCP